MRFRYLTTLAMLVVATAAVLAAVMTGPASATPSKNSTCTSCHSGTASGAITATPSTGTPAAGAAYTVAIGIGLSSGGNTGYHIAATDAFGGATTWVAVSGGPGSQTSWTANMSAPATAGTYYYKVWCAKGPASSSGQAKFATYSITVPAPAAPATLSSLTPNHARTGASVTIAGTNLGTSGTVRFGATSATTTTWSGASITATVPASLAAGATTVTVTPAGGAASNALAFTVDAPPASIAALTGLSPASGLVGTTLTISGTGMGASGAVAIGGITAATTAWSAASITCTVPPGLTLGVQERRRDSHRRSGLQRAALHGHRSIRLQRRPSPGSRRTMPRPARSITIAGTNLGGGGACALGMRRRQRQPGARSRSRRPCRRASPPAPRA